MTYVRIGLLVIVGALSLAAGAAKLMQVDQEVSFFLAAGLQPVWLLPLGALQVIGPALTLLGRTRRIGAGLTGLGFLVSTLVILANGNPGFAAISLIPVAIAFFLFATRPPGSEPARDARAEPPASP
ncbi:hypothetical protein [Maricaulis sp.]|uniref:hypothetical protein n=1 Tax=Maricaulis sp. TaxID=1486257 RepID=UPI002B279255|nr:hypothetical protein [Maricaulis sp.]